MPTVIVYYFAALRETKAREKEEVALQPRETVGDLYARLFPASSGPSIPVGFAVNRNYVAASHALQEGDEVAFIPPIGGG